MSNKKVLIIENDFKDYKKIKDIIPHGLSSVFDDENLMSSDLSDKEKDAVNIFKSSEPSALKRSMDFVAETINTHYRDIRLIICDLKINSNDKAGGKIIEMIRSSSGLIFNKPWYGKEIPILIVSKLTDMDQLMASHKASGNCYFLSKGSAFTIEGSNLLWSIEKTLVEQFEEKYRRNDARKKYKVALSFTGLNVDDEEKKFSIRKFIESIAKELSVKYTGERVFFDMFHQEKTNSKNTDSFVKVYNDSEYVVVFISEGYKNKKSRWSTAEWEVIKKRNLEHDVIFLVVDSTFEEKEFRSCLGVEERIYRDMLALCSKFNALLKVEDSESDSYIKNNATTQSITQIAAYAVNHYVEKTTEISQDAARFIINTIKERESL